MNIQKNPGRHVPWAWLAAFCKPKRKPTVAKKPTVRVTTAMAREAEPTFNRFVKENFSKHGPELSRGGRKFLAKAASAVRLRVVKKMYQRFLDDGGTVGDWESFWAALVKYLPQIIALIMSLLPK